MLIAEEQAGGVWSCSGEDLSEPARRVFGTAPTVNMVIAEGWNPLGGGCLSHHLGSGERRAAVVCWSGTLAAGLFERDLATWGPEGWRAMLECAAGLAREAEELGVSVLVRPHARHVLSDVQRCVRFIEEFKGMRVGLALDPCALLEASMLERASDHLERAMGSLGGVCSAVMLTNVAVSPGGGSEEDLELAPAAAHLGVVDAGALGGLVGRYVPRNTPVAIPGGDTGAAIAALGLGR